MDAPGSGWCANAPTSARHLASLTPRHTDVLGERRLAARRPPTQRTTIDTADHAAGRKSRLIPRWRRVVCQTLARLSYLFVDPA